MFSIRFSQDPRFEAKFGRFAGTTCRFVETVLGDDERRIAAPLDFWDEAAYEAQWRQGVERLFNGAESSGLIKRIEDPGGRAQVVDFWELYRDGDAVLVHSRGWDAPEFGEPLDPTQIYEAVLPYTTHHEGLPPLEWRIGIADLADWLRTRPA